jgi:threonine dehydrogenase-like Zn-dependent dehydrogenase
MISCTNDKYRKSYGFQRNGGMAPYILAEEKDLISLPNELSFTDGAQIACGYGTVYEGLERIGINGNDVLLVTGLGPVGLAALQLAKALGARKLIGIDTKQERVDLAKKLGLLDEGFVAGKDNVNQVRALTNGKGCEKTMDCSGSKIGRQVCIESARQWGKIW